MATVTIDLAKLEGLAEAKAIRGIQTAALRGEAILKADILNRAGTGRLYEYEFRMINGRAVPIKSLPRPPHRASAPGEPPAPDKGASGLLGATQADEQVRREGGDLVGRIVANKEYALMLEKGTERMAARPFLSRLKSDHADDLQKAFVAGARG